MKLASLYSDSDVEIVGDPSSLLALGALLRSGTETDLDLLDIPVDSGLRRASRLVVDVTTGPASIHYDRETVTISGGAGPLDILGRNIASLGERASEPDSGNHIHIEHLAGSDDWYVASDSMPLVVSLLDPAF
jgi:hypothetical protein